MPNLLRGRPSLRLKDFDYSQPGAYFVTICSWRRDLIFGSIFDGKIIINDCGRVVEKAWLELPKRYQNILVDEFSVLPDHFHGILFHLEASQDIKTASVGLSEVIRGFKSRSARQTNLILDATGVPVWQRGFYDRIIRNQSELDMIRRYIINNSIQWNPGEPYPPEIR